MHGSTTQLAFADWRSGVERTFHRVRRVSFATGAIGGAAGALLWEWTGGWVIAGVMAAAFLHSLGVVRYPVAVEREIALDAAIIGFTVWVVGTRGLGYLLIYPLAVALLLGQRRLAWSIIGISAVTNTLLYIDTAFPSWPLADTIAGIFEAPPLDESGNEVIIWLALYAVGGALLWYLWVVAGHAREVERRNAEILRSASHDLRNAVGVVQGLTEILATDDGHEDGGAEILSAIAESAAEATAISSDLLSLAQGSRDAAVNASEFDLAGLVVTLASSYSSFDLHAPDGLRVFSDPQRVGQIVRNLMTNAKRHGGPQVVVTTLSEGDQALVRVADNGDGVPGEAEDVFTARGSTHAQGLGIGLATSHDLAFRIGARLTYERTAGWSVFCLSLPLSQAGASR
ncbi:MAG: HAMP domain-containing histidine kinase [Acidimicrobiia bacterium]|nr:HAMP domain-containing histidine kinase [Acidimicrobiia bacterium]